eukprot:PhF_6_TR9193/c0_g1_i2/m.14363
MPSTADVMIEILLPVIGSLAILVYMTDRFFIFYSIAWAVALTGVKFACKSIFGSDLVANYPRWSYFSSIFLQVVVLPVCSFGILYTHWNSMDDWMWGSNPGDIDFWKTQSMASIAGAMMKDYWIYGGGNEWFFVAHHLVSIYAAAFCHSSPVWSGHVAVSGIQAESLSLVYNFRTLYPSRHTRIQQIFWMF